MSTNFMFKTNNIKNRIMRVISNKIELAQKEYDETIKRIDEKAQQDVAEIYASADISKIEVDEETIKREEIQSIEYTYSCWIEDIRLTKKEKEAIDNIVERLAQLARQ